MRATLLLFSLPLFAQQIHVTAQPLATVTLHVTGRVQSVKTSTVNFGRLPKQYRAADWTVTSEAAQPVKIALALILQEIHTSPDISILSAASNTDVVSDAQGSNPINATARIGAGVAGGTSAAIALKLIPAGGWGTYVVIGISAATILLQYIFPTLKSHAVQSITAMLPPILNLDAAGTPGATASGMVIIEMAKGAKAPEPLDIMVTLPWTGATQ